MGAGVAADAAADMAETAGTVEDTQSSPAVGPILPLVVTRPQTSPYRAARAPSLADTGETQDDGLKLTKTVTPKADGGYTVHLEAYTTGTVTTSTTTKPCDIVLVLDQSGSMADDFNGNTANKETDTRQYAMKQAVNTFIDNVAKKPRMKAWNTGSRSLSLRENPRTRSAMIRIRKTEIVIIFLRS